jgi:uncharacterized membrane protein YdbT with pleckstrin-like domain
MSDVYLDRMLGEREQILLVTRQHWLMLVRELMVEVLLAIALIVLVTLILIVWLATPLVALGYLLLVLPALSMWRDIAGWTSHKYVVTNRRVIQVFGVINKNVTDSSLEKVNDVKMEQSLLGRLFNYGDIEILTASELGINRFTRIGNPVRFKTAMLNAKEKLEHEPAAPVADVPALLAQLGKLREEGVLSQEEFESKKADLLARL